MKNIPTLANKQKKINKATAFQIINDISAGKHEGDEISISPVELAALYSFFMPPVPRKPKTPEEWVALAMPKNDVRFYLNYLYSDGNRLMATDGTRLHVYKTEKYPAGFYDAAMNSVAVDGTYPQIDQVIPSNVKEVSIPPEAELDMKQGLPVIRFAGTTFQKTQFEQATGFFNTYTARRDTSDPRSSLLIESGDCFAVLTAAKRGDTA